jgi:PhnB protein
MSMVEVFKTSVSDTGMARRLISGIRQAWGYQASFDLEDRDRILRVQAAEAEVKVPALLRLLAAEGVEARLLTDEEEPGMDDDTYNAMDTQINAYLTFDQQCREAMGFYQSCLGGTLSIQTVEESPMAAQWPAHVRDHVLHASLVKDGLVLLASDMAPQEGLVRGNTISLALNCSSEEEIDRYFTRLAEGGRVTHPLHRFFDGMIGALTDRYGMNWVLKL